MTYEITFVVVALLLNSSSLPSSSYLCPSQIVNQRAPDPDVEMRSTATDNTSERTVVMAEEDYRVSSSFIGVTNEQAEREEEEEEAKKKSPIIKTQMTLAETETESEIRSSSPEAEGPTSSVGAVDPSANANSNTDAPINLAPRGSVFRYFGADDGSFVLPPSVHLQPIHSTNVYMFDSSAHRNPSTVADVPAASKPNSDDPPLFLSDFLDLDSITSNSDVPVASKPPPLLVSSFTSNSSSTVDSRCSSPDIFSATYAEVPVTPPPPPNTNTEVLLHPPTLKAHRGAVFAYFGDLDDDMLNPPVLSLSEDSFHTPIPRC